MSTFDITWSDEYATGVDIIDEQHKVLFDYFLEVEDIVQSGNAEDIRQMVKKLLDYAVWHNEFEEGLMEQAGYPMVVPHGKIHAAFKERALAYEKKIEKEDNPIKLAREIRTDIALWLINHIKREDQHYVNDVQAFLKKSKRKGGKLFGLFG